MTIDEAREHQGEPVTWLGWGNRAEEGTIHRVIAGTVLVRRPGTSVLAAASPGQLTLAGGAGWLF